MPIVIAKQVTLRHQVSQHTISLLQTCASRGYERGETKPNAAAMAKLAKVLDTTVDFLMHGSVDGYFAQ